MRFTANIQNFTEDIETVDAFWKKARQMIARKEMVVTTHDGGFSEDFLMRKTFGSAAGNPFVRGMSVDRKIAAMWHYRKNGIRIFHIPLTDMIAKTAIVVETPNGLEWYHNKGSLITLGLDCPLMIFDAARNNRVHFFRDAEHPKKIVSFSGDISCRYDLGPATLDISFTIMGNMRYKKVQVKPFDHFSCRVDFKSSAKVFSIIDLDVSGVFDRIGVEEFDIFSDNPFGSDETRILFLDELLQFFEQKKLDDNSP